MGENDFQYGYTLPYESASHSSYKYFGVYMPVVKVSGMSCGHCTGSVAEALKKIDGISSVEVDLESGEARWEETSPVDIAVVTAAITGIGFEVVGKPL